MAKHPTSPSIGKPCKKVPVIMQMEALECGAASLAKLKCTRIVVAHRLSAIQHCDSILVIDEGRIAEEGSFDELMKLNGIFADLVERQIA